MPSSCDTPPRAEAARLVLEYWEDYAAIAPRSLWLSKRLIPVKKVLTAEVRRRFQELVVVS